MNEFSGRSAVRFIEDDSKQVELGFNVVKVVGFFDKSTMEVVEKELMAIVERIKNMDLVLDLAKLTYINSEGIGFLMMLSAHLQKNGHRLVLVGALPQVLDTFNAVGLNKVIPCCASFGDCVSELSSKS